MISVLINIADDLESNLTIVNRLRQMSDPAASERPGPGKWSPKEIIGHLIDSAANNHQRFVRMQMQPHLDLAGYDGDAWVDIQSYRDRPWLELLSLWETYNRHLAHVIRTMNPAALKNTWVTPEGRTVDLEFVARDYIVHMRHHLESISH